MRESEKCKAPVKKMRTVASLSNSPWKSFAQTQSCPWLRLRPQDRGALPSSLTIPLRGPSEAPGGLSPQWRLCLQALLTGWWATGPQPPAPTLPPDLRLLGAPPAETLPILGGLPREALGMWLLNAVTSPKWRPEGQRGLCFSQHQHTGEPHMQKRGSTHHPTGWALQETTEDLFRKARGSGQGWLAPTPGQDLQVRHKTRKVDTLLHQHP